jgi:acyl-CoA carboxylase epsilon subunit
VTRPGQHDSSAGEPALRVVRGDATPEEIAALVAILMARSEQGGAARRPARPAPGAWADRASQLRRPLHPGPGAWRRSALPG